MKIAFLCDNFPHPEAGGIEATTSVLAEEFKRQGHSCYCAWYVKRNTEDDTYRYMVSEVFDDVLRYDPAAPEALSDFIRANGVQIAVVQSAKLSMCQTYAAAGGAKVVATFHTRPGRDRLLFSSQMKEQKVTSLRTLFRKIKNTLFFRARLEKRVAKARVRMQEPVGKVDKYVLLSERYIPLFMSAYGIPEEYLPKFTAIGNSLKFNEFATAADIDKKEKEVLVVSRLRDGVKKISTVLYAWEKIQAAGKVDDGWRLTIVGHGEDEQMYKKLAEKLRLRNVSFEGRRNPLEYYRRASIFMMTSMYEGWGMTLTESHQMGVVPIALDTYESLRDIVTDDYNGVIVPPGDTDLLATEMMALMDDEPRRKRLALNGVESSHRFTREIIAGKWLSMFEDMLKS